MFPSSLVVVGSLAPPIPLVPAACATKCASESLSVLQINAWRFRSDIRIFGDNNITTFRTLGDLPQKTNKLILFIKCVAVNVYRFQFKIQDGELGIDTQKTSIKQPTVSAVDISRPWKNPAAIGNIMVDDNQHPVPIMFEIQIEVLRNLIGSHFPIYIYI